jgi:hypothetical protein
MRMKSFRPLRELLTTWLCLVPLWILAGCRESPEQAAQVKVLESRIGVLESALAKSQSAGAPRLGNIMGMVQMRHSKLWFAGEQANWPLAAYELHELEEDFEDVEKYYPTHGSAGLPLGQMAAQLPKSAVTALKQAIHSGDRAQFAASFDALTASCNACHAAASVAFNVIQRPSSPLFSNQDFTPQTAINAGLPERGVQTVGKRAMPK